MNPIDLSKLAIAFTERSLCTRCGTCVGVCPEDAIVLDADMYPALVEDKCTECGLCGVTCPGGRVSFREMAQITFGDDTDVADFDGRYESVYVGYASDPKIRANGAGGGVITAILWDLVKRGVVDGAVVTRMSRDAPWRGEVFVARTYEEMLESQQSKYIVIPTNRIFQEIRKLPGRYAMAALPCQVHGYRLMQKHAPDLAKKIYTIVGLFCASSLEPYVAEEMLKMKGVRKEDVANFQFRGGKWPGRIRAILKNGHIVNLHYSNFKDGAINYLTYLYSPPRCQMCIDGSSEFADVAVSDAWTRDEYGNYLFEAHSKLLVRTPRGRQIVEGAIRSGALVAKDVSTDPNYRTHRLHRKNKGTNIPLRVARLKKKGIPVPEYDRELGPTTRAERRKERIDSFIMKLGRIHGIRYPLFAFLTSRYGAPFVIVRQWIKSRKYRPEHDGSKKRG